MTLIVGSVYVKHTDRSYTPKSKLFIVVAESRTNDNYLVVFINSNQSKVSYIQQYQPCFEPTDSRKYLSHPSYIDCYDPKDFPPYDFEGARKIGEVCSEDLDLIRQLIRNNDTIPLGIIKSFL